MTARLDSAVIDQQLAHRSVRKYLDAPVTDAQIERVVTAAQRASTSSNLQVWSVIVVRNPETKARLADALGGLPYVAAAPVFLVWIADHARNAAILRDRGADTDTLRLIENTLIGAIDVGIAAQNALLAAESLGLGGVFVGGIRNNPAAVAAELRLPPHTFAMAGMCLGVPDPTEGTGVKPRLPLDAVLHRETYDPERWRSATAAYEGDYEAYFADQGHPGRSWVRTLIGRLGSIAGLHGRQTMRESLRAQGFDSE